MSRYLIEIDITGDPAAVENVIDELVANIAFMDLEHVGVQIESAEVIENG